MAHFVGVDIIELARIEKAANRWGERFFRRIYTETELKLCHSRTGALATRFAGKEAVMKVLGTGARGVAWREIEILHYRSGKPYIKLHNRAQIEAEKSGIKEIDISLSHSLEYATATAIGVT